MSITLNYAAKLEAKETLEGNTDALSATTRIVTWNAYDEAATYTGATTPAVSKIAEKLIALVAGALTIDLTALAGYSANGGTVDATGLKLQFMRVKNLGANAMTFATGGANGYNFGGPVTVQPGGLVLIAGNSGLPAVAAGVKNIGVTGTGTQTAEVTLIFG